MGENVDCKNHDEIEAIEFNFDQMLDDKKLGRDESGKFRGCDDHLSFLPHLRDNPVLPRC